jgi:transcriptional regulator with PAS, ATPase and Fis domain
LRSIERLVEIAARDAPVLISGETGTGKEVVAHAIHRMSRRASGPFVALNVAARSEGLFEEDLVGHEPGAYTDAAQRRLGALAQAHGGTLLLDEINSLSPHGQIVLLRLLDEKIHRPIGGRARRSDVRFIAATNEPPMGLVASRRFRLDLYHRLAALIVHIPPLRDRVEDIAPLCAHFLGKHANGRKVRLSPAAVAMLHAHRWDGNVRELEHAILRALVATDGEVIQVEHLLPPEAPPPASATYQDLRKEFDRNFLTNLLARHQGNITRSACEAGLHRRDLQRMIRRVLGGAAERRRPATGSRIPTSATTHGGLGHQASGGVRESPALAPVAPREASDTTPVPHREAPARDLLIPC